MLSYEEYKDLINASLLNYIPTIGSYASTLKDSMEYSLRIGGKRIRPVLLLAACDFAGGNIHEAMPYACALEYIHTYSLIHDDLPAMDNDDFRRGMPTNHIKFGEDVAILAGDGLLNTAAEIMFSQINKCTNEAKFKNQAAAGYEIISRSGVRGMIAGQTADVINENSLVSPDLVHYIEEHKCGDLISAAVISGLYIAGADESIISDFRTYAMNIGIAFQILDDILDFEGDESMLGKKIGKDANLEKCNYVCVHGIDAAKSELHNLTEDAKLIASKYGEQANFFITFADMLEHRNN